MRKCVEIKLTEGYAIQGKMLVVVSKSVVRVFEIEKEISEKEKRMLSLNLKMALLFLQKKLNSRSQINIKDGEIYFDDRFSIRATKGVAKISIEL